MSGGGPFCDLCESGNTPKGCTCAHTFQCALCIHIEAREAAAKGAPATTEPPAPAAPPVGQKHDAEKPRMDLLPFDALWKVAEVLTYGARKYTPDNWRRVPDARARYLAAALRHLASWSQGERLDPESGLPHLGHAACCVLFLLSLDKPAAPP